MHYIKPTLIKIKHIKIEEIINNQYFLPLSFFKAAII